MTKVDVDRHLVEFVHDRDVDCPSCGYELRRLESPVCPECGEKLTLCVGLENVRLRLLLLATVPGAGGFVFALFMTAMLLYQLSRGGGAGFSNEFWVVFSFCWLIGLTTLILMMRARWFMQRSLLARASMAGTLWVVSVIFATWFFVTVA